MVFLKIYLYFRIYLIRLHSIKNSSIIYFYHYCKYIDILLKVKYINMIFANRVRSETCFAFLQNLYAMSRDHLMHVITVHKCACNFDDIFFSKNETATKMLLEKRSRSLQTVSPIIIVMSRDAITLFFILLKLQLSGMIFIQRWCVVRHYNHNS